MSGFAAFNPTYAFAWNYFKLIVVFTPVLTAASSNHLAVTVFTCV
jgi:hypothetical protein